MYRGEVVLHDSLSCRVLFGLSGNLAGNDNKKMVCQVSQILELHPYTQPCSGTSLLSTHNFPLACSFTGT